MVFAQVALAGAPISVEDLRDPFNTRDAHAERMAPRRRPMCLGPAAWDDIAKCLKTSQPAWRVVAHPSAHTQVVGGPGLPPAEREGRMYAQRPDGKWQLVDNEDVFTSVVGETTMAAGKLTVRRIELRKVEPVGDRGVLRQKSAILCGLPDEGGGCQVLPYDCSSLVGGRSNGVVKGTIVLHPEGGVEVVGDRTHAGGYCSI
jgi:hypothetical protein